MPDATRAKTHASGAAGARRSRGTACGKALTDVARRVVTAGAEAEPSAPLTGRRRARRSWQRSGDRSLHQLDDLLLYHGAPLLQRVRHRPQIPVVEVGRVLEAQGRVPVAELARVLEEDDDLAVRVRVGGHPVPGLWRQIRCGSGHRQMHALGERTILGCHRRDLVADLLQPVGLPGALLALGAQLVGAPLHRGTLLSGEAAGLGRGILRGHSHTPFRRSRPGPMPAIWGKARPDDTLALLDS